MEKLLDDRKMSGNDLIKDLTAGDDDEDLD